MTGPTPNKGYEAAAVQRLGMIVKQLTDLLPMVGVNSEIGQAAMKALNTLSKHVPAGSVSPASERNNIERMAMQNAQQTQLAQQMRQQQSAPGGGGQPQQKAA